MMLDAEAAEWSATRLVFESVSILMCYFHVAYNIKKWLSSSGFNELTRSSNLT